MTCWILARGCVEGFCPACVFGGDVLAENACDLSVVIPTALSCDPGRDRQNSRHVAFDHAPDDAGAARSAVAFGRRSGHDSAEVAHLAEDFPDFLLIEAGSLGYRGRGPNAPTDGVFNSSAARHAGARSASKATASLSTGAAACGFQTSLQA